MPDDFTRVVGAVLAEDGSIEKLILEQEDHKQHEVALASGVGDSITVVKNGAVLNGTNLAGFVAHPAIDPVGDSLSLVDGLVQVDSEGIYEPFVQIEYTGSGSGRDVAVYIVVTDADDVEVFPSYVFAIQGKQTEFNGLYAHGSIPGIQIPAGGKITVNGYAANGAVGDNAADYKVTLRVVRRAG